MVPCVDAVRLWADSAVDLTIDSSVLASAMEGHEMDTFTLSVGRHWIVRALGRNPLVRFSDRVEAMTLVLVFAAALVVTPVAGAIGTAVFETRARIYAEEALTRHTVTATAIEDSTAIVEEKVEAYRVRARWLAGGVEHTGSVDAASFAKVGDHVDVWVNSSGNQVAPPTPTSRAGTDAMFAGAAVWFFAMTGIAGLAASVHSWLTHRRYRGWDREWAALVSNDGGRTGRQT